MQRSPRRDLRAAMAESPPLGTAGAIRERERMQTTPNRASPTGPRRLLQFDTARTHDTTRTMNPRILALHSTSPGSVTARHDAPVRDSAAEADSIMRRQAYEQAAREELEAELLRTIKEDLRNLAVQVDADDWMFPNRVPLPFRM